MGTQSIPTPFLEGLETEQGKEKTPTTHPLGWTAGPHGPAGLSPPGAPETRARPRCPDRVDSVGLPARRRRSGEGGAGGRLDLALTARGPPSPPRERRVAGGRHQPPPCAARSHNGTRREGAAAAPIPVPGRGLRAAGEAVRGWGQKENPSLPLPTQTAKGLQPAVPGAGEQLGRERKCHPLQSRVVTSPLQAACSGGVCTSHDPAPPSPPKPARARFLPQPRLPPLPRPLSPTFALPAPAPLSTAPAPPPPRALWNRHGGAAGARAQVRGSEKRACPGSTLPPSSVLAGCVGTRARGHGGVQRQRFSAPSSHSS
nr:uncharacterized protein LOC129526219 [Gorilla gorilla gorilla]